jgi:hypothetical protein
VPPADVGDVLEARDAHGLLVKSKFTPVPERAIDIVAPPQAPDPPRLNPGFADSILNLLKMLSSVTKPPDIAGTVASMTEDDPGVESEKASDSTPG